MIKLKKENKKEIKLWDWIREECKDWRTFVIFFIVSFILYAPTWGGYLYYFILKSKWAFSMASVYAAFWLGPFTPFWPICIAITLGIKRLMEKKENKNNKK